MICRAINVANEEGDVRIQRNTIWGNPYRVSEYGRTKALELYKEHLKTEIRSGRITINDLESLRGKRLICCCKPKPCHGDIIADLVNRFFKDTPTLDEFF